VLHLEIVLASLSAALQVEEALVRVGDAVRSTDVVQDLGTVGVTSRVVVGKNG
jgi:hypothetical protein